MGFVLGVGLALVVGLGLQFGSGIFSKDKHVLHIVSIGIPVSPKYFHMISSHFVFLFLKKSSIEDFLLCFFYYQFVAGTQPINSVAFVFDGINYGSFDFAYSAYSMVNSTISFKFPSFMYFCNCYTSPFCSYETFLCTGYGGCSKHWMLICSV